MTSQTPRLSSYHGSARTAQAVRDEIARRWGAAEADKYDPFRNCLTLRRWGSLGYRVRKGERSIRSITIIEEKDDSGAVVRKHARTVHLFYERQVEKVNS